MRIAAALVIAVLGLVPARNASAQLAPANAAGAAMGHLHLIVADVPAAQKFFVTLGGTAATIRDNVAIKFPGAVIMLRAGTPTGGTVGSVINHFGFNVKNSKETLAKWNAAGLRTETNAPDKKTLSDDFVKAQLASGRNPGQFFVYTPDNLTRIEILEEQGQPLPIVFHHIHYYVAESAIPEIKAWYATHFSAVPGMRGTNHAADLPGVNLSFAASPTATVPTRGRMIDHIGFEVANLEDFCKKLAASGVTFMTPFSKRPDGVSTAFITDPWGTTIELTDGMRGL